MNKTLFRKELSSAVSQIEMLNYQNEIYRIELTEIQNIILSDTMNNDEKLEMLSAIF